MSKCRRCGRPIENPKSLIRGYGPICYSKINHSQKSLTEFYDKGETEENNKPELSEYYQYFQNVKCWCGEDLSHEPLEHYKHEGGYPVKNYKHDQWIFVECPKCGICLSLNHAIHKQERLKAVA